jgi:hypothetical protein
MLGRQRRDGGGARPALEPLHGEVHVDDGEEGPRHAPARPVVARLEAQRARHVALVRGQHRAHAVRGLRSPGAGAGRGPGAAGAPGGDAAVGVGDAGELDRGGGGGGAGGRGDGDEEGQRHGDAAGGHADRRVEHVAGDGRAGRLAAAAAGGRRGDAAVGGVGGHGRRWREVAGEGGEACGEGGGGGMQVPERSAQRGCDVGRVADMQRGWEEDLGGRRRSIGVAGLKYFVCWKPDGVDGKSGVCNQMARYGSVGRCRRGLIAYCFHRLRLLSCAGLPANACLARLFSGLIRADMAAG